MNDALALALAVGCVASAALIGVRTAAGTYRWHSAIPILLTAQVLLVVQAVLDVAGLVGGHRPRELAAHLAYLAFAVLVLPIATTQVRGDDGRWAGMYVLVALLVMAVLVVRLQTTWRVA